MDWEVESSKREKAEFRREILKTTGWIWRLSKKWRWAGGWGHRMWHGELQTMRRIWSSIGQFNRVLQSRDCPLEMSPSWAEMVILQYPHLMQSWGEWWRCRSWTVSANWTPCCIESRCPDTVMIWKRLSRTFKSSFSTLYFWNLWGLLLSWNRVSEISGWPTSAQC